MNTNNTYFTRTLKILDGSNAMVLVLGPWTSSTQNSPYVSKEKFKIIIKNMLIIN